MDVGQIFSAQVVSLSCFASELMSLAKGSVEMLVNDLLDVRRRKDPTHPSVCMLIL